MPDLVIRFAGPAGSNRLDEDKQKKKIQIEGEGNPAG
jgi:hypothetical protein